jgi:hypothetical protein
MEHRLEMAKKSGEIGGTTSSSNLTTNSTIGGVDPNDLDLIMQHRIRLAKLEDTYYDDSYDDEEEDDENNDDDLEGSSSKGKVQDDDVYIDRRKRFRRAYDVALATDTQGYQVFATTSGIGGGNVTSTADRTAPELVAISWAAFCTEVLPEMDAVVRIQALDCENVFHRLKLASALMRQKKALLRSRMKKARLSFSADDEPDESGGPAVG